VPLRIIRHDQIFEMAGTNESNGTDENRIDFSSRSGAHSARAFSSAVRFLDRVDSDYLAGALPSRRSAMRGYPSRSGVED